MTGYYTTERGRLLRLCNMSTRHLRSVLAGLERVRQHRTELAEEIREELWAREEHLC